MAVENWIDRVARIWEISDGKGGTLKSFLVYEKNEMPEALPSQPCVLTFIPELELEYSMGGPVLGFWRGFSEFHLTKSVQKDQYASLILFYKRIIAAAAGNLTLGNQVEGFGLRSDEGSAIRGPVTMQYGDEAPHLGFIVYWKVKENLIGEITPATGA